MADEETKVELSDDPFSTWGASEPYKAKWAEANDVDLSKPAPSQSLSEAEAKEAGLVEAGAGASTSGDAAPAAGVTTGTTSSPAATVASTSPVSSSGVAGGTTR